MAENLILAALPNDERKRLEPFLTEREYAIDDLLIEKEKPIEKIMFLDTVVTSTVQVMSDGSWIETGLMGIEGVVGTQLWLGSERTSSTTFVQIGGVGTEISSSDFIREVMNKPESPLNHLIGLYVHAFLCMTSTIAACNRLHTVDQQLCRWLKMTHNRVRRDAFYLRQEFIARMLGVQRPTVSIAARTLQKAGLISYSRGNIKILDPEGLNEGACECLELIETQFDKIFGRSWRAAMDD